MRKTAYCKPTVCSLPISLDLRDVGYVGYTLRHLGFVQTDATTPNIVAPTMLGVVAYVLAVLCKRMQKTLNNVVTCSASWKETAHKSL